MAGHLLGADADGDGSGVGVHVGQARSLGRVSQAQDMVEELLRAVRQPRARQLLEQRRAGARVQASQAAGRRRPDRLARRQPPNAPHQLLDRDASPAALVSTSATPVPAPGQRTPRCHRNLYCDELPRQL